MTKDARILTAIMAVALLARATRLGESLWYDEIAAWRAYGVLGPGAILGTYFDPSNHVGHTLLTWISMGLLEPVLGGELALRVPALVASMLSVVAIWFLGRLTLGRRGALVAAGLAAIMPVSVLAGTEARGYSLMICCAAGSTAMLLAGWRTSRRRWWILYALLCAVGTWVHPVSMFVPAGHAVWIAWQFKAGARPREARAAAVSLGAAALVTVALYAPILPAMFQLRSTLAARSITQPTLLGAEGAHMLLQMGGAWSWWAAAPGLVLLLVGLATMRPRLRRSVTLAWAGWGLFVLAIAFTGSWFYARFALFALPGAILLVAGGIGALSRRNRSMGIGAAVAMVIASAADLALRPPHQPLRDAADAVAAEAEPGADVIVIGLRHQVLDVYAGDLNLVYSIPHGGDLAAVLPTTDARWLVLYYPRSVDDRARDLIEDAGFRRHMRFRGWADWSNGDVDVYVRPDGRIVGTE